MPCEVDIYPAALKCICYTICYTIYLSTFCLQFDCIDVQVIDNQRIKKDIFFDKKACMVARYLNDDWHCSFPRLPEMDTR